MGQPKPRKGSKKDETALLRSVLAGDQPLEALQAPEDPRIVKVAKRVIWGINKFIMDGRTYTREQIQDYKHERDAVVITVDEMEYPEGWKESYDLRKAEAAEAIEAQIKAKKDKPTPDSGKPDRVANRPLGANSGMVMQSVAIPQTAATMGTSVGERDNTPYYLVEGMDHLFNMTL